MNKYSYLGATLFCMVFVYVIDSMGVDVKTLLLVGLAFLFSMCGMILNELYERRMSAVNFERTIRNRLEEIDFDMQVMRDCNFDLLKERADNLVKTVETLGKLSELTKKMQETEQRLNEKNVEEANNPGRPVGARK